MAAGQVGPNPISLVSGATAAARRAVSEAGPNGPPTLASDGFSTKEGSILHILTNIPDGAGTVTWSMWLFDGASELWAKHTGLGTDGVVTVSDDIEFATFFDNPAISFIETNGAERVYIEVVSLVAPATSFEAWISRTL